MKKLIFMFFLGGAVFAQNNNKAKMCIVDTVTFGFTPKTVLIINNNSATDTIFVSPNSLFPATNTVKLSGNGEGLLRLGTIDTIFIKATATSAKSKKIRIETN